MSAQRNYCVRCHAERRSTEISTDMICCANCIAANAAESARINKKLAEPSTTAEKIEFLLSESRKVKQVIPGGKMRTVTYPTPARGRSAKNIDRILRRGRERRARAIANGDDLTTLPPNSPIRKKAEADWARLLKYGIPGPGQSPRGVAGRMATTARSQSLRERARALHREQPGLSEQQIGAQIGRTVRTVRRYLNGK